MVVVLGIDEAGRGPVIGSLVMAGAVLDETEFNILKELDVKDSKLLTPEKREAIAKELKKVVKYKLFIADVEEVDKAVDGMGDSLNLLEGRKIAKLIDHFKPDKAIIDCPSTNIAAFTETIRRMIKHKKTELVLEHKADMNHIIVAAASVLAKVERDKRVKALEKKYDVVIGSGYASDPITQEFLKGHFESHAQLFRKSWQTYKRIVESKLQRKLGDY